MLILCRENGAVLMCLACERKAPASSPWTRHFIPNCSVHSVVKEYQHCSGVNLWLTDIHPGKSLTHPSRKVIDSSIQGSHWLIHPGKSSTHPSREVIDSSIQGSHWLIHPGKSLTHPSREVIDSSACAKEICDKHRPLLAYSWSDGFSFRWRKMHFYTKLNKSNSFLPLNPLPLVTPMQSSISSWANTSETGTDFSRRSLAQSILSAMLPPLSWISMMWAFFWRLFIFFICKISHHILRRLYIYFIYLLGGGGFFFLKEHRILYVWESSITYTSQVKYYLVFIRTEAINTTLYPAI